MLSDDDISFLARCLYKIPSRGDVESHTFTEPKLKEFMIESGIDPDDLGQDWRDFFNSFDKRRCSNCESFERSCSCSDRSIVDTCYRFDASFIVKEWAENIANKTWFSSVQVERVRDLHWKLLAELDSLGQVTFRVFFDGEGFSSYEPNPLKQRFPVGFVNLRYAKKKEYAFTWLNLLDSSSWPTTRDKLVKLQEPISLSICQESSTAAETNTEAIVDGLRDYLHDVGYSVSEQPSHALPEIAEYINISEVVFVAERTDGESAVLLCSCDIGNGSLHFHRYDGKGLSSVEDSEPATAARDKMREKVSEFNQIHSGSDTLQSSAKGLSALIALIAGVPLIQFLNLVDLGLGQQKQFYILIGLVGISLAVLLAIFFLVLYPARKLRKYSWSIDT